MASRSDYGEESMTQVSVLQDGFCASRILSRESSIGKSSRIYYRSAEGIPFKWESMPGTPKHPQEDDVVPPPSPSPLMQSLGLSLPNVDHDKPQRVPLKTFKIGNLKEIMKRRINFDVEMMLGKKNKKKPGACVEVLEVVKDSSVSSSASTCLSESSSFSSHSRMWDLSMNDGPFCCSPWSIPSVEGKTRIYYCSGSHDDTAFAMEKEEVDDDHEDDSLFLNRILPRLPSGDLSGPSSHDINNKRAAAVGVPFQWEMQPGTPKRQLPENDDLIPPQRQLALPPPKAAIVRKGPWTRTAWSWIKDKGRGTSKMGTATAISHRKTTKFALSWRYFKSSS
ncbi:uncharacterized protein LOC127244048 isoform X2 [Andrographis paniculata]|uniref:uncharacterized protein LOC127244048 isoform X2 n=1 Tax=Andrographis paniculata TaxID=175694 RepID=UPI0021E92288|nr:uncharacterized protein LOC127244048 isoform X2 [Andrographis paniculata]